MANHVIVDAGKMKDNNFMGKIHEAIESLELKSVNV